ncbi:osteopontin isoform X2 [Nerophis ophidion]|uniref:osteopontin isoform X2 n=1 Tax=Nerophis ophidion TaxID=159077 RepID=UPI002ADF8536|nr:osteopontin isoform X2 [Nerophis ophidion]
MKVALVFVLLFAGVLCRSARKYDSSAESSEEVVRRPPPPIFRKRVDRVSQIRAAAVRALQRFLAPAFFDSDESSDSSDKVAVHTPAVVNYDNYETTDPAASDPPPVDNKDDEDSDDDDDDESEESDSDEEEDDEEEDDSSESGESTTLAPDTVTPVIVTEETTEEPLVPTIVTDGDSGRGDSMGGHPGDYKTYVYMQEKNYHKAPSPYKSYNYDSGKKSGYDMPTGNEVEKGYKMESYPQVHSDLLEGDSSTPEEEVDNQDISGPSQNQDVLPAEEVVVEEEEEEEKAATSDSGSSSNPEEEEEESASQEAAATPGAADSDSDESESTESDSDERGMGPGPGPTADAVVITAK